MNAQARHRDLDAARVDLYDIYTKQHSTSGDASSVHTVCCEAGLTSVDAQWCAVCHGARRVRRGGARQARRGDCRGDAVGKYAKLYIDAAPRRGSADTARPRCDDFHGTVNSVAVP